MLSMASMPAFYTSHTHQTKYSSTMACPLSSPSLPSTSPPASQCPSSPPETLSEFSPSPSPVSSPVFVVCDAPLVAPKPISRCFPPILQFDLPDLDQDLSRPPYTTRSLKRKASFDQDDDLVPEQSSFKRRIVTCTSRPSYPTRSRAYPEIRIGRTAQSRRILVQ